MRENTCLVSDSISTTTTSTTEVCKETFKTQKGPFSCDSERVLYLLKSKACHVVPYVGKVKAKLRYGLSNYGSKHRASRRLIEKLLRNVFTLTIALMATVELMIEIL